MLTKLPIVNLDPSLLFYLTLRGLLSVAVVAAELFVWCIIFTSNPSMYSGLSARLLKCSECHTVIYPTNLERTLHSGQLVTQRSLSDYSYVEPPPSGHM